MRMFNPGVGSDSFPVGCDVREGVADGRWWKGIRVEVLELESETFRTLFHC